MNVAEAISTIVRLSPSERAKVMQEIMESFDDVPLSEAEIAHLARIMAQEASDPHSGRNWEEIEAELIAQEEQ
jgi:putative addiction module component (TIGR02574 family)